MNSRLIYSVKELFTGYLSAGKQFVIPEYQRGYKWDNQQIVQLLKDINHFEYVEGTEMFYCLQNITLVKTSDDDYNVVDGQQRLTTLVLLLSFLGETKLIENRLFYNVRPSSNDFIQEYIIGNKSDIIRVFDCNGENCNWSGFVEQLKSDSCRDFDHQDVYYMFKAYSKIKCWMSENKINLEQFSSKLLNHVKVIVNAPKTKDEQTLFNNLNSGQVHLDGADLVRAIIITRLPKVVHNNELDEREIVMVNETRVKIGMELDRINSWWIDKRDYYRSIVRAVKTKKSDSILFNEVNYPIDCLYKLFVLASKDKEISVEYFEEKSSDITAFYENLIKLQRTIEDWYNDQLLYHLVFYVLYYTSTNFTTLYEQWLSKKTTRNSFVDFLKKQIVDEFNSWNEAYAILAANYPANVKNSGDVTHTDNSGNISNDSAASDNHTNANKCYFDENWFQSNQNELVKVMILVDIIDSTDEKKENGQTSCLPVDAMIKKTEDEKEHIFPQTPRSNKPKDNNAEEIKAYVDYINNKKPSEDMPDLKFDVSETGKWEEKEWSNMKEKINERIKQIIPINSLGNMCLLDKSINASYGNDFFAVKHLKLMQKAKEGIYIRPHVMDAFCKAFRSSESNDLNYMRSWEISDIIEREKYIVKQVKDFLNIK